ncbi:MAG: hypothetical protein IH626_11150 [Rhodospirillales bacterium]|nr:hypothetical protein [Rhodospirillales bacterium]
MSFKELAATKFAFTRATAKHMIDIKPYDVPTDDLPAKHPKTIPAKVASAPHS